MGVKTSIGWTDHTFNPWWGCTEASPGCDNCYAREFAKRYGWGWGPSADRREFGDKHWNEPLKWDRESAAAGVKRLVFCASMADVMDPAVSQAWRDRLWRLIAETPHLIWLLLTKHPQLYDKQLAHTFIHGNVILGTTAENQDYYDIRWPHLAKAAGLRGLKTFISHEPAIGSLLPARALMPYGRIARGMRMAYPDWVITGGESGAISKMRPYNFQWALSLIAWGRENSVPIFVKQMGSVPVLHMNDKDDYIAVVAKSSPSLAAAAERDLERMWPEGTFFGNRTRRPELNGLQVLLPGKGDDPSLWPECLRVQEFSVARVGALQVNTLEVLT